MPLNVSSKSGSRRSEPAGQMKADEQVVFFALNERERRIFFPATESRFPAGAVWADPADLDSSRWSETIKRVRPTVMVSCWKTPALPVAWLSDPDLSLRYICHLTGSIRSLVPREYLERGIAVTNWGTIPRTQVAEHALLLALGALRNQGRWREYIAKDRSQRAISELGTRTLHGRRVGIHGFGMIAQTLLKLLRPFGVEVAVYSQGVPPALIMEAGARPVPDLASLFAGAEVLFECESLTPASKGIVTGEVLGRLPDGAVFVNVARGGLVDEAALWREAKHERIRLALDVVSDEPVTMESPAMHLPGAIVSPHIGGPTLDRYHECGMHALENIERFLAQSELKSQITPEIFDRST